MTAIGKIAAVSLDTSDPKGLAGFYAKLLDYEIVFESDEFIALKGKNGVGIATQRVENYVAPSWPAEQVPKQIHLEVSVANLDDAEAAAIAIGATKPDTQPSPEHWRDLNDPAGPPYSITTMIPLDF